MNARHQTGSGPNTADSIMTVVESGHEILKLTGIAVPGLDAAMKGMRALSRLAGPAPGEAGGYAGAALAPGTFLYDHTARPIDKAIIMSTTMEQVRSRRASVVLLTARAFGPSGIDNLRRAFPRIFQGTQLICCLVVDRPDDTSGKAYLAMMFFDDRIAFVNSNGAWRCSSYREDGRWFGSKGIFRRRLVCGKEEVNLFGGELDQFLFYINFIVKLEQDYHILVAQRIHKGKLANMSTFNQFVAMRVQGSDA